MAPRLCRGPSSGGGGPYSMACAGAAQLASRPASRPLDGERFAFVLQAWLGGEPLAHAPPAAAAAPPCGALYPPASLRRLRRLGAGAFARVDLCEAHEAGGGRVRVAAKALLPEARAHAAARRALAYGTYVRSRGVVLVLVLVHAAPSATEAAALRALAASRASSEGPPPAVVGFEGVALVEAAGTGGEDGLVLCMEPFGDGTTARDAILRCMQGDRCYAGGAALRWARAAARGVAEMHALRPAPVVHRDVKPGNLLLGSAGRVDEAGARLGDLGLARFVLSCGQVCKETAAEKVGVKASAASMDMTARTGTHPYMAPEVFRGDKYGPPADVFSLGVTLFELFGQEMLRARYEANGGSADVGAFVRRWHGDGWRPAFPKQMPPALCALITKCWDWDPAARPTAGTVARVLEEIADADAAAEVEWMHGLLPVPSSPLAPLQKQLTKSVAGLGDMARTLYAIGEGVGVRTRALVGGAALDACLPRSAGGAYRRMRKAGPDEAQSHHEPACVDAPTPQQVAG